MDSGPHVTVQVTGPLEALPTEAARKPTFPYQGTPTSATWGGGREGNIGLGKNVKKEIYKGKNEKKKKKGEKMESKRLNRTQHRGKIIIFKEGGERRRKEKIGFPDKNLAL